jgi:hypothetical protein
MKSRQEFKDDQEYYDYLFVYISVQAMQGFLFQNIMYAETDSVVEANHPTNISSRSLRLAYNMVEALKNHKI